MTENIDVEIVAKKARYPWNRKPTSKTSKSAIYATLLYCKSQPTTINHFNIQYLQLQYIPFRCFIHSRQRILGRSGRKWRERLVHVRRRHQCGSNAHSGHIPSPFTTLRIVTLFQRTRSPPHSMPIRLHQHLSNDETVTRNVDSLRSLDADR